MDSRIKAEILSGKWNLAPWAPELAGLMGGISPEEVMIYQIERSEREFAEAKTDSEKAQKILEILSRDAV